MSVSEDTAKRIADALERLAKVMEGDPAIPPPFGLHRCVMCGLDHGGAMCPKLIPTAHNGDGP